MTTAGPGNTTALDHVTVVTRLTSAEITPQYDPRTVVKRMQRALNEAAS
jgi:hypothetical protein